MAHRCQMLRAPVPSEGPTGAHTPSEGAAQRCPILRGPHTRRRMGETDTADRVGGENQWVMARREAGMLECPARDVAVRAEVAVRGRRWRCGHAGPYIVFFFFFVFLFAWVGHIGLRLCDLIVHRRRPVGGAPPCRMANAGRCDYKKKKKKRFPALVHP